MNGNRVMDRKLIVWATAAVALVSLVAKGAVWWQESRRKKKSNEIPTQWRRVGEIEALSVYPLKSGRANEVAVAECTETGLVTVPENNALQLLDRSFVVYSEETGSYKTARQHPKMVLITVTVTGDPADRQVTFSTPGMERDLKFIVPKSDENATVVTSTWMKEKLAAVDCGDEAAAWLSEHLLGKTNGIRLGYHLGEKPQKNVDALPWAEFKQVYKNLRNDDYGIYSDMTSYMLLGKNSVTDLNTRLPVGVKPSTASRFRPNFVVSGSAAYAEDSWDWVKIGDRAVFRSVKPCIRCTFTTIDPETGIKDMVNNEPYKTLKTYRQMKDPAAIKLEGSDPIMGLYMGLHTAGQVKIGDEVYVGI